MAKIGIVSLGCPKNQVDSECMLGALELEDFKVVEPSQAEVLIINTCAFIRAAVEESIECILEACEEKPKKKIIVTGCLPQRYGKNLIEAVPEIDYAVGVGNYGTIVDVVKKVIRNEKGISVSPPTPIFPETPRHLLSPSHYAYIKIAEGCSNRCTYCVIPLLRGEYRSRSIQSILREAEDLSSRGVKELILTAQDTALYGVDVYEKPSLPRLFRKLSEIPGIEWLRILYLHPAHISTELIDAIVSSKKVCRYLDMPIQHISDRILSRMHRGISGNSIRSLIDFLKSEIPEVALRTTVMVGFPGETDEEFDELLEFVQEIEFDALGVFKFSPEVNVEVLNLGPEVDGELADERAAVLQEVQREISLGKNLSLVGKTQTILVDKKIDRNKLKGRTEFQAPDIDGAVYVTASDLHAGDFAEVTIIDADDYDLFACRKSLRNCHSVLQREQDLGS